ncbi:MAG: hypothetical protein KGZ58_00015 [Ignavibacteriales bacterium]|nr:hypothetical protein [Ignavibacteriales bacterium]
MKNTPVARENLLTNMITLGFGRTFTPPYTECLEINCTCSNDFRTGVNGFQTGAGGFRTGADGFRTGANGFRTGVNGFRTGVDGFRTCADGFQTGVNGFQTGVNGFQTGADGFRTCVNGIRTSTEMIYNCEICEKTRFFQILALRWLKRNFFLTIVQKEKKICQLGWEMIGTELANYGFEKKYQLAFSRSGLHLLVREIFAKSIDVEKIISYFLPKFFSTVFYFTVTRRRRRAIKPLADFTAQLLPLPQCL